MTSHKPLWIRWWFSLNISRILLRTWFRVTALPRRRVVTIPILDGGNILLLAIEGLLRRDMSMAFKVRFVQAGLVFLLLIFTVVMYNDVMRRLPIHS